LACKSSNYGIQTKELHFCFVDFLCGNLASHSTFSNPHLITKKAACSSDQRVLCVHKSAAFSLLPMFWHSFKLTFKLCSSNGEVTQSQHIVSELSEIPLTHICGGKVQKNYNKLLQLVSRNCFPRAARN
jgi:hypothetical protein